jgi:hypothetical protein
MRGNGTSSYIRAAHTRLMPYEIDATESNNNNGINKVHSNHVLRVVATQCYDKRDGNY